MPKRKRDGAESPAAESGEEQGKSMRQRRVEHKLEQGYKLLNRAFKTAKGFERQKLGRRRKTACEKGDSKDVQRIDAETEAIKTLDFAAAAKNYLHKSLLKFKAIAESPDLPKVVSRPPAPMPNTATANVIARLCNSNPVKEALPSVLKEINLALGVKIPETTLNGKKRLRAKDFEDAQKATKISAKSKQRAASVSDEESEDDADNDDPTPALRMARRPHSDNEDDFSDSENEQDAQSDLGAEYDSDDFAKFDSRIAASSDEDEDDEELSSEPEKGKALRARPLRSTTADVSPSASPEPTRLSKSSAKPTKSAFIPSLTMGGYWSGSESEPEDDVDVAPRKNRRGQRARQAILEKKYGKNAKHLQKQAAAGKNDRNQGWDPKRGATDGSGPRKRGLQPRSGRSAPRTFEAKDVGKLPPKKHRDDSGPLHPSWEAAKKAKEAKVTASYQGKKVTFD
ncbi:hypothetical protein AAFC00_004227 [Neodothiora populina]|uniref:Bud22 domain-containing protein n=1 Tax=Neodothiora populina TaxID=2781224 RepID=A0ABR3PJ73_9PEZI